MVKIRVNRVNSLKKEINHTTPKLIGNYSPEVQELIVALMNGCDKAEYVSSQDSYSNPRVFDSRIKLMKI